MTNRNKNKDQFKGVEGSIFGLFPESSRSLYEECVASLEAHYKNPKIQVASTLDPWESSVVSTTQKIQEAEVVIADVGHRLRAQRTKEDHSTTIAKRIPTPKKRPPIGSREIYYSGVRPR